MLTVRPCGPILTFVTDPRSSNAGGVEVAATAHITFNTTQHKSGRVRRPAQGTLALKPRAPATLTLPTFIVARLVTVQCAIPRVTSLTVALIGGGSVDARGEGVTVVETQPAFLDIWAGGVGPDRILLFAVQVLQLQLHLQRSRRC